MSKKRSWLGLIKRLLFSETHHHQQQKIKRRRWLFGRLKRTKTLPSPSPSPSTTQHEPIQITKHDADDEEKKQSKCEDDDLFKYQDELSKLSEIVVTNEANLSLSISQYESHVRSLATIKIQTSYRGYLARKALRALKGFVKLQAIIRGRAVRRQAMTTLKCLQSIAKIQSEVCAKRCQLIRGKDGELQLQDLRCENPKIQLCRLRRLDNELLTKEEEIDIILRKREAILRSKRVKAYSFNHRHSADSEDGVTQGRLRYWLEQYVSDEVSKKEDQFGGKQHKLRNLDSVNNFDHMAYLSRRSFQKHKKQNSYDEDNLLPANSPTNLPTYMAATESAKAKTRSSTSPRLKPLHFEAYSDGDSPYKNKFSPMSSINSEATSSGYSKVSNKCSFSSPHQKSPSLKGVCGPVRSNKNLK
ncbi:protein IQ-DOMAIN 11 isoform X1 [Beta vulgaris subsp. vulgaris]|uniref:protein IQ-DOMAIN 11 isoform X1 n=1 Tax=Beta vulgaris subsp. vulgaris TaxID=3555 RepID=UPI0020371D08|nr:protein IQ-DOMAIN 11 isoform X1 [Beta vulgaris subsp. vulgaris]